MRTQEEIVTRMRASKGTFGFDIEALCPYLTFAHAKEFLKEDFKEDDWKPVAQEKALDDLREYMQFAWGKVENHRGISAGRSVEKCAAWAWLLGRDDVAAAAVDDRNYAQYGAPALKLICEAFELPIPRDRELQRMMEGKPCVDNCANGCGYG